MPLPKVTLAAALAVAVGVALPLSAQATTTKTKPKPKKVTVKVAAAKAAPKAIHGLGAILPTARTAAAFRSATTFGDDDLPASKSLAGAPPIGNQGQVGDCVEWALDYGLMGYWAINNEVGVGFAPMFAYTQVVSGKAPTGGSDPNKAITSAKTIGVDTFEDYWQGSADYKDAPTAAEKANAKNFKMTGVSTLWTGANQGATAQTAVEQALANGDPVALGFNVYSDFDTYTGGLYDTTSGTSLGGHMAAVYGYDADGVYLNNSWGPSWGDNGVAHMSWDWVDKAVSAAYTVTGISATTAVAAPAPLLVTMSATKALISGGTQISVTGANLGSATAVTVGGDAVTSFSVLPSMNWQSGLSIVLPEHAGGTVDLQITTPSGTTKVAKTDKITFLPDPPSIISLQSDGPGGTEMSAAGGETVTVSGTNLASVTSLKFAGAAVPFTHVDDSTLTFVVPTNHAAGRNLPVVVTNAGGSDTYTNITLDAPNQPSITSLSPDTVNLLGKTTVTVTGTDLGHVKQLLVGPLNVKFTIVSDTEITFVAPKPPKALTTAVLLWDFWKHQGSHPITFSKTASAGAKHR